MIETVMNNYEWFLAAALMISEGLSQIPALKQNSILDIVKDSIKKIMSFAKKIKEEDKEDKAE